jgi:ribosomal protein S18 acetylase RimI-like enzyme
VRAENDGVVAFYRGLGYSVEQRVSMGKVLGSAPEDSK